MKNSKIKKLKLSEDLEDLGSFRRWIKNNIEIYNDEGKGIKVVPFSHILIYLDFLVEEVKKNNTTTTYHVWTKKIRKIRRKTIKMIKSEKRAE